jgi:hypothetical protein
MQSESSLPGHKRLKLDLTLSQFNLVYILPEYFLKIHFNRIIPCLDLQNFLFLFKIFWLKFLMCSWYHPLDLIILRNTQARLILCDSFLRDFTLTQLENLHHFLNLRDNFWFNAIWNRQSVVARIFCGRLAESDVTVTASVTYKDWLHWWYNHAAHLVSSSTALTFLTNVSETHKSTPPSAIQMKTWQKTISTKGKLDVTSQLEKG